MKTDVYTLPVKPLSGNFEAPAVTALRLQVDGSLLCGLSFANPCLLRLHPGDGNTFKQVDNLAQEGGFEEDALAVVNGLRPSQTGETTFALLHEGYLPGFVKGLFGKRIEGRKGAELMKFLTEQGGGAVRHSVIEIHSGRINPRRVKEPGVLWDTLQLGSFVFGLENGSVWREPYLNAEKRETLRSDLGPNFAFHRDEDGYFWFMRSSGQLLRMGLTDIKAVPTPLKAPDTSGLFLSSGSSVDGWIYLAAGDSKTLLRVRRNPVSGEDESQKVKTFEGRITSILAVDESSVSELFVAVEGSNGAQIWTLKLIKPQDPEEIAPVPLIEKVRELAEFKCVSSLTTRARPADVAQVDPIPEDGEQDGAGALSTAEISAAREAMAPPVAKETGPVTVWAGEGRLGWGVEKSDRPLHIVRLTL